MIRVRLIAALVCVLVFPTELGHKRTPTSIFIRHGLASTAMPELLKRSTCGHSLSSKKASAEVRHGVQAAAQVSSLEELLEALLCLRSLADPVYLGAIHLHSARSRRSRGKSGVCRLVSAGQEVHGGVIHLRGHEVLHCTGLGVHFHGTEFHGADSDGLPAHECMDGQNLLEKSCLPVIAAPHDIVNHVSHAAARSILPSKSFLLSHFRLHEHSALVHV